MKLSLIQFGAIEIDGERYERDVIIDRGAVSRRSKKLSKPYRAQFGHTPVSAAEQIPWGPAGSRLVIGSGVHGMLPVMAEVTREAKRREVDLVVVPTEEACRLLSDPPDDEVRAILHVTC